MVRYENSRKQFINLTKALSLLSPIYNTAFYLTLTTESSTMGVNKLELTEKKSLDSPSSRSSVLPV